MDKKKQEEYHFVKEHIKKIPPDRKKRRMSLGWTILLAAVFGVVAALVFCAVKPAIGIQQKTFIRGCRTKHKHIVTQIASPVAMS